MCLFLSVLSSAAELFQSPTMLYISSDVAGPYCTALTAVHI